MKQPNKDTAWKSQRRHQDKVARRPKTPLEEARARARTSSAMASKRAQEDEAQRIAILAQKKQQDLEKAQRYLQKQEMDRQRWMQQEAYKVVREHEKRLLAGLTYVARSMGIMVSLKNHPRLKKIQILMDAIDKKEAEKSLSLAWVKAHRTQRALAYRANCEDMIALPGDAVPYVRKRQLMAGFWPISVDYPVTVEQIVVDTMRLLILVKYHTPYEFKAPKPEEVIVWIGKEIEDETETPYDTTGVWVYRVSTGSMVHIPSPVKEKPIIDVDIDAPLREPVRKRRPKAKRKTRKPRVIRERVTVEAPKAGERLKTEEPEPIEEALPTPPPKQVAVNLLEATTQEVIEDDDWGI